MAHSRRLSHALDRAQPLSTVAPLAIGGQRASRSYQSAVYHVNSRVLLTRLSSLNAVHRSVPAPDSSVHVPHRDQYNVVGTWSGAKVALTQSSSLVPSEYAARFMMRQAAKPNIIGLDSKTILPERTTQRPDKAFLPSINRCKSRSSSQQDYVSLSGSPAGRMTPKRKRNGVESGTQVDIVVAYPCCYRHHCFGVAAVGVVAAAVIVAVLISFLLLKSQLL